MLGTISLLYWFLLIGALPTWPHSRSWDTIHWGLGLIILDHTLTSAVGPHLEE